jgi:hypothetical protein
LTWWLWRVIKVSKGENMLRDDWEQKLVDFILSQTNSNKLDWGLHGTSYCALIKHESESVSITSLGDRLELHLNGNSRIINIMDIAEEFNTNIRESMEHKNKMKFVNLVDELYEKEFGNAG